MTAPAHLGPHAASPWRPLRRALTALAVSVIAVIGLAGAAAADPETADPGRREAWQSTGDLDVDLAAQVNLAQGIIGFCVGDADGGPRSKGRAEEWAYPARRTIEAGVPYVPDPRTVRGDAAALEVPADRTAQLAYVLAAHNATAAADPAEGMAVHYAIRSLSIGGASDQQERARTGVKARARAILAEAEAAAGPYTVAPVLTADDGAPGLTLAVVGVRSATGAFLAGYEYVASITGPGAFAGGVTVLSGTTGAAGLTHSVAVTGTGAVAVTVEVRDLPATSFAVLESGPESGHAQDLFVSGAPVNAAGQSESIAVTNAVLVIPEEAAAPSPSEPVPTDAGAAPTPARTPSLGATTVPSIERASTAPLGDRPTPGAASGPPTAPSSGRTSVAASSARELAATGTDPRDLLLGGAALSAVGAGAVAFSRSRGRRARRVPAAGR